MKFWIFVTTCGILLPLINAWDTGPSLKGEAILNAQYLGKVEKRQTTEEEYAVPPYYSEPSLNAGALCGVEAPNLLLILKGRSLEYHKYPWQVYIETESVSGSINMCGGVVISERYILTAAHCVLSLDDETLEVTDLKYRISVRYGSNEVNHGLEASVAEFCVHPNFNATDYLRNDMSIIKLKHPLDFSIPEAVHAICLPVPEIMKDEISGRNVTILGWGRDEDNKLHLNKLQETVVKVMENTDCENYSKTKMNLPEDFVLAETFVCTSGSEGKGACRGDSGGTLQLKLPNDQYVLVGLVSAGFRGCVPGFPSLFTRVSTHLPWIHLVIKEGPHPSICTHYGNCLSGSCHHDALRPNSITLNRDASGNAQTLHACMFPLISYAIHYTLQ